ncbi:hypothetical protein ACLOJK_014703 [Asimina triloba]
MAEGQFLTFEDLGMIRDSYNIPNSIIKLPLASHETSRDYHPRHLCLNEYMLRAGVRVPCEFGVAEALVAFHVSPTRVTPHSWKVIQAMAWFCERGGYWVDGYLWRELLVCRLLRGYAVFSRRGDVKTIDNPPPIPRQVSPYVISGDCLSLVSLEGGVPSLVQVDASDHGDASALFSRGERKKGGGGWGGTVRKHICRQGGVAWHFRPRHEATLSFAVPLEEELKASKAEVACLCALLQEDVTRSSVVVEYLHSNVYHRRMEFELTHYSHDGACICVVTLQASHTGVAYACRFLCVRAGVAYTDFSRCLVFSTVIAYVGSFRSVGARVAYAG